MNRNTTKSHRKKNILYGIFFFLCFLCFPHSSSAVSVPSAITTLAGSADATSVTLTWTAPSNGGASITDYTIQYRLNGDTSWTTFTDGVSTTASATVTGLTTDTVYDFSVMAVNSQGTAAISNVIPVKAGYIFITSPMKGVVGAPYVATRAITDDYIAPFYIPYIQTSTTLSITATVASAGLPSSGGVKFVLNKGLSTEQTVYDMSSPFTASFTSLAKAEYTIDVYIVDSSQVVQTSAGNHDQATNLGIGDIILGVGDSITEGYYDTDLGSTPIANWTTAPAGTVSNDNRQFPQHGAFSGRWKEGFLTKLQNTLVSYYGYPVFIMNDGKAGITSAGYVSMMSGAGYRTRVTALAPNKALVNLGVNDAYNNLTASSLQTNLTTIINTELKTRYGISAANIWLAYPNYSIDSAFHNLLEPYQPYYTTVISNTGVSAGPDFWTFFKNHYNDGYHYIDLAATSQDVHPNTAGFAQMARLYAINMMTPANFSVSESLGQMNFSWTSRATLESSLAAYKISYGTSSGTYTATSTSATMNTSNFVAGTTYYTVVQESDTDTYSPNFTPRSTEISFTRTTALAPTSFSVTSENNAMTLTWTAPTDIGTSAISDYVIQYRENGTTSWNTFADSVSAVTTAQITGLINGNLYDFRVIPVNNGGQGTPSSVVSATQMIVNSRRGGFIPSMPSITVVTPRDIVTQPVTPTIIQNISTVTNPVFSKKVVYFATGKKGSDVLELQRFLVTQGFFPKEIKVTDFYGSVTKASVIKFQKKYNIPATGIVGPKTMDKIIALKNQNSIKTSTPEDVCPAVKIC
ncbi:MAG: fibronectin type III domain-containing protein [bacterium]